MINYFFIWVEYQFTKLPLMRRRDSLPGHYSMISIKNYTMIFVLLKISVLSIWRSLKVRRFYKNIFKRLKSWRKRSKILNEEFFPWLVLCRQILVVGCLLEILRFFFICPVYHQRWIHIHRIGKTLLFEHFSTVFVVRAVVITEFLISNGSLIAIPLIGAITSMKRL